MSYNKKIILFIFLLVGTGVALILSTLLTPDMEYRLITIGQVSTELPDLGGLQSYRKDGWEGKTSLNHGKSQWAMILTRQVRSRIPLSDFLSPELQIKPLKLSKNMLFGVQAKGKSFRRYMYLIRYRDSLYWLESGSRSSTLVAIKTITDHMIVHLSVDGNPLFPDVEALTKRTTAFVSPRYSQSICFFILIMAGTLAITFGVVLVVFYFGTREPLRYPERPKKVFRGVTIKMNLIPMRIQMIDCNLALMNDGLTVYYFRKEMARIRFADIREPTQIKVGSTILFRQPFIRFLFPEPQSIHMPGIKKIQKMKKISLYMKKNQIKHLTRESDFPFKEQMLYSDF